MRSHPSSSSEIGVSVEMTSLSGIEDNGVLLSISMITYNQARFVREAIESVFAQNMPFKWELVISDDASTDDTADVIEAMVKEHPNVKFYRQPKNLGMHRNYKFAIDHCTGQFIAQLEGDDYWTDPDKNRKQIEFMQAHPKMAWCCTNGIVIGETGNFLKESVVNRPYEFTLQAFAEPKMFFNPMNNTVVLRREAEPKVYPDFIYDIPQIDTALHYLRARNGTIGFMPDKTIAYRQHVDSSTGRRDALGAENYLDWLKLYNGLRKMLPESVSKHFNDKAAYFHMALNYLDREEHRLFLKNWCLSAGHPTWRDSFHYLRLWIFGR